jgi:hypothetical protein
VDSLEKLQAGIYTELLGGVWLGTTERGGAISITGDIEVKVTSVATTKLLCECPPMATATSLQLWGKLLDTAYEAMTVSAFIIHIQKPESSIVLKCCCKCCTAQLFLEDSCRQLS